MTLWDTDTPKPALTGFFVARTFMLSHIVGIQTVWDTEKTITSKAMTTHNVSAMPIKMPVVKLP